MEVQEMRRNERYYNKDEISNDLFQSKPMFLELETEIPHKGEGETGGWLMRLFVVVPLIS